MIENIKIQTNKKEKNYSQYPKTITCLQLSVFPFSPYLLIKKKKDKSHIYILYWAYLLSITKVIKILQATLVEVGV